MASNRIGRINEEIQRELATLIRTVKDPRVHGLVSITAVETTPDLRYSKIYVSVLDKSDVKEVVKGLKSAAGYLRRELGSALKLRYTPELLFVEDDSIGKGAHILSMLRDPEVVKPANPANAHINLDAEDEE
ncbi:ribosome-binding factor A [Flavonifractor sp. An92]|uniref:30S ribosome-binding factor RbfA n=1 Tax=Flavonifractor sp. An92 TaxID=1965666 RepID=UPI000B3897A7|nr:MULTISPECIES: 30S ribosome-binding factor RbfA [unclassified Flavonifractor]OUN06849.1 ribosome-binding factor A [Flavonifractor sp. An92]OUQ26068.1 ribosome-binding factor A [Flavonifractor sp. An135]